MKKMTRWLSLLLAVGMLLSLLTACGSDTTSSAEEPSSGTEQSAAEVPAEATAPVPEEPTGAETLETEASVEEQEETGPVLTEEQQKLLGLIPEGEYLTFQEYPLSEDPDATLSVFYSMHPLLNQFFETPQTCPSRQRPRRSQGSILITPLHPL